MHAEVFSLQLAMVVDAHLQCRGLDYDGLIAELDRQAETMPPEQIECGRQLILAAKQFAERGDAEAEKLRNNPNFQAHAANCPKCAEFAGLDRRRGASRGRAQDVDRELTAAAANAPGVREADPRERLLLGRIGHYGSGRFA